MIHCGRCHTDKPRSEFAPSAAVRGNGYCRPCHRDYYRERERDPVVRAAQRKRARDKIRIDPERSRRLTLRTRNKDLRIRYGITLAEYDARLSAQGGVCACCQSAAPGYPSGRSFAVDHDHETGVIRGLICSKCNKGIGLLGDNAAGVAKALAYLRRGTHADPDMLSAASSSTRFERN